MKTPTKRKETGHQRELESRMQIALTGLKETFPAGISLMRNGVSLTQAQLVRQLEDLRSPFIKARATSTLRHQSVADRRTTEPQAREFLVQLRASLIGFYGRESPHLKAFGMTSGRPAPKPESKKPKA